jgi:hypothetical protein
MTSRRCFPLPWSIEELDACFVVKDHDAQQYFEDEPGRRSAAKLLTSEEAQRGVSSYQKLSLVFRARFSFEFFQCRVVAHAFPNCDDCDVA